uniref:Uncharacterized protein n=2 Tax=Physcomitrium patens TaxID=3218 RepID=A9T7B8_PHYPA|nr:hypothetical protein PHYPA_008911 [Physcomitrium patens]
MSRHLLSNIISRCSNSMPESGESSSARYLVSILRKVELHDAAGAHWNWSASVQIEDMNPMQEMVLQEQIDQWSIFIAILLGIPIEIDTAEQSTTDYGTGFDFAAVSNPGTHITGSDSSCTRHAQHDKPLQRVSPKSAYWINEYTRRQIRGRDLSFDECLEIVQPLVTAFREVSKISIATDVLEIFATWPIDLVEPFINNPQALREKLLSITSDLGLIASKEVNCEDDVDYLSEAFGTIDANDYNDLLMESFEDPSLPPALFSAVLDGLSPVPLKISSEELDVANYVKSIGLSYFLALNLMLFCDHNKFEESCKGIICNL